MVLEDVDSDWENEKEQEQPDQVLEDAETQTERSTSLMAGMKSEAGVVTLETLEEILREERKKSARLVEEVAIQAAEMAIRQLGQEQAARLPAVAEPEGDAGEQLPGIQEEENEEDPDNYDKLKCLVDVGPIEVSQPQQENPPSTKQEDAPKPEPQLDENVVTKQPAVTGTGVPSPATAQEEEVAQGCGVPASCSGLKSYFRRVPFLPQCLDRFNRLLKDYNISLPKPHCPQSVTQLSQHLPRLPKRPQLDQLTQNLPKPKLPRQLPKLPQKLPKLPLQLPKLPDKLSKLPENLPGLPKQLPHLPPQLTKLPQLTRQYYLNVRNRLNSLKPSPEQQDA
ncbi:hypothetical protein SKAU_G00342750 [Synaphobranchus kaupii]|uniref:Uncharacterized protein n=1 Tax=Synaphobranchus kaupii TaxID=118154 RepID=A0A9Q1EIX3_SYNKA|nr:hypothetical protein SKAU_G00342750 [Synaphobranchus kaupii]